MLSNGTKQFLVKWVEYVVTTLNPTNRSRSIEVPVGNELCSFKIEQCSNELGLHFRNVNTDFFRCGIIYCAKEDFMAEFEILLNKTFCSSCLKFVEPGNDMCWDCQSERLVFDENCGICLNNLSVSNSIKLYTCEHRVCRLCLRQLACEREDEENKWYEVDCPHCRATSRYHETDFKTVYFRTSEE
jgi:hypothetical protein